LEAFDEVDIQSPEALGAACMLIRQRPVGWADRIKRYIDLRDAKEIKGVAQYFILEALYQEYYFRHLTIVELSSMEGVIAHLLSYAGFLAGKQETIKRNIERTRPLIGLITRDIKR
jgi:hypothetical protein